MPISLSCPQCQRRLQIPEVHLGKRARCRTCGAVFVTATDAVASATPVSGPGKKPRGDEAGDVTPRPPSPRATVQVKVVRDPYRLLRGVYRGEFASDGLQLRRGKEEVIRIPVGTSAEARGGNRVSAILDGREVTLAVSGMGLYSERLARDVALFLEGGRGVPDLADYALPRALMAVALLPAGILLIALAGGAIGGALGGALAGGLIGANLAIIRKEAWPRAARVAACLGVGASGYLLLATAVFGLWSLAHKGDAAGVATGAGAGAARAVSHEEVAGWGTPEDPDGDCRFQVGGDTAIIEVPGTVHELLPPPRKTNAPRVLGPVEGDFVAEVRVTGEVRPADPPAPSSHIAFHGAGLLLWGDAGNFIRLERAAFVRDAQLHTYVLFEHLTQGAPSNGQDVPYLGGPVTLRLERRGAQVLGSFSVDGVRWETLGPKTFSAPKATLGVAAVNTASTPFFARFEGLKVGKP